MQNNNSPSIRASSAAPAIAHDEISERIAFPPFPLNQGVATGRISSKQENRSNTPKSDGESLRGMTGFSFGAKTGRISSNQSNSSEVEKQNDSSST